MSDHLASTVASPRLTRSARDWLTLELSLPGQPPLVAHLPDHADDRRAP